MKREKATVAIMIGCFLRDLIGLVLTLCIIVANV